MRRMKNGHGATRRGGGCTNEPGRGTSSSQAAAAGQRLFARGPLETLGNHLMLNYTLTAETSRGGATIVETLQGEE